MRLQFPNHGHRNKKGSSEFLFFGVLNEVASEPEILSVSYEIRSTARGCMVRRVMEWRRSNKPERNTTPNKIGEHVAITNRLNIVSSILASVAHGRSFGRSTRGGKGDSAG